MNATIQSPPLDARAAGTVSQLAQLRQWFARRTATQLVWSAVVASAIIALVSLKNDAIAYDPESWVVWARELAGPGKFATTTWGTAWKPLPVILIAPFTLITRGNADMYWWLFLARFGSILGVFAAGTLAKRYAGWAAAILTAALIVISPWWIQDTTFAKAEPLAAALGIMVILAHQKGWIRFGCVLLLMMGLLRPEVTPIAFVYGVWLIRTHRLTIWELGLGGAIMIFLWAIPQELHTGTTALHVALHGGAVSGDARYATIPFLAVFWDAADYMRGLPALFGAAAAVLVVYGYLRQRRGTGGFFSIIGSTSEERLLVLLGPIWIFIVAVSTQAGTAGPTRYSEPGIMLLTVMGSVLAVRLAGKSSIRVLAVVLITFGSTLSLTSMSLQAQRTNILERSSVVMASMQHQVSTLKCPGLRVTERYWASFLAEMTGQSLPQSVIWNKTFPIWYTVVCAPSRAS